MKSDSETTRRQKARLMENVLSTYGIQLPEWFVEGTTTVEFRALAAILERARDRHSAGDQVPTKPAADVYCETCHNVHKRPEVVGPGNVKFWPNHEYIVRTKATGQKYPREWRMGYIGFGMGMQFSARGPDRTHSKQYGGTVTLDLQHIIYAEEVERDEAKRHVGQVLREAS
jgi:hypothetical protein